MLAAAVLVVAGLVLVVVGVRGLRGTLPRNRFAGVRTEVTLRSDETFQVANRVAGLPIAAAGAVFITAGAVMPAVSGTLTQVVVVLVGAMGGFGLVLAGGVLGHRAASALPDPKPSGGCGGCACGGCGSAPA